MGPRILDLQECLHHDGRKIWLEAIEMNGITPVSFYAERMPFLRFDAQDRVLMFDMRADMYGETWRCWDALPEKTDWMPDREEKYAEILDSVDAGKKKKPAGKK